MSHFSSDDITFELLILAQLASSRRSFWQRKALDESHASCLRSSALWTPPPILKAPERPGATWKAAALAGLIALSPLGALPTYAESTLQVGMSVIDARTGKPLMDAKILNEHGTVLGITGQDGKILLSVSLSSTQRLVIEKPGYRSFPVIRTQLRDNNLIAMLPSQATSPAVATPAPVATPKQAVTPHVPEHAVTTPKPVPAATPKVTPKPVPVATSKVTPKPVPVATPKVTPKPVPVATPKFKPALNPQGKTTAKPAPEKRIKAQRYIVRRGDSLWGIAKREYGDPTRWTALYAANHPPIRQAHLLYPGMVLKLPSHSTHARKTAAKAGMVAVRRGDCLWLIAERKLGNGERWREIYRLNRRKVINPRLIIPGQLLQLPRK